MEPSRKSSPTSVRVQRLLALALAGWLLFDFPLLTLWSSNATLVFVWWALLIALLAWVMERASSDDDDDDNEREDERP